MVLLLPLTEDEQVKGCSKCSHLGLASSVRERSSFYALSRGGFESWCRACNTRRCMRYQKETGVGKVYRRKQIERLRSDPVKWEEFKRARREYERTYRQKNSERVKALGRERYRWQSREVAEVAKNRTSGITLPIEPFRGWIVALMEKETREGNGGEAERRVSARLGVTARRVRSYLYEWESVDECIVDRCCSREGSVMLWELYPDQLEYHHVR